jgi:hypothetical protein
MTFTEISHSEICTQVRSTVTLTQEQNKNLPFRSKVTIVSKIQLLCAIIEEIPMNLE